MDGSITQELPAAQHSTAPQVSGASIQGPISDFRVRAEADARRMQTHVRDETGTEIRWELICRAYYDIFNKAERAKALSPPSKQGRVIIGAVGIPGTAISVTRLIFCPGNNCKPDQVNDGSNGNEIIRLNSIINIKEKNKGISGTDGQITIEFHQGGHVNPSMNKVIIQPIINSDMNRELEDRPVTEAEGGWAAATSMLGKVAKLVKEKSPIYAQEGDYGNTRLRVRDKIIEAALHEDSLGWMVGTKSPTPIRLTTTRDREYSGEGAEGAEGFRKGYPVTLNQNLHGGGKGRSKTKRRKYNKTRTRKRKSKSKRRKRRKKSKRR